MCHCTCRLKLGLLIFMFILYSYHKDVINNQCFTSYLGAFLHVLRRQPSCFLVCMCEMCLCTYTTTVCVGVYREWSELSTCCLSVAHSHTCSLSQRTLTNHSQGLLLLVLLLFDKDLQVCECLCGQVVVVSHTFVHTHIHIHTCTHTNLSVESKTKHLEISSGKKDWIQLYLYCMSVHLRACPSTSVYTWCYRDTGLRCCCSEG